MLIDWFTVVAQTLNFLILVWLMSRYLYKPILAAIDAREVRVAAALADADAKAAEAKRDRDDLERKNAEFDQERAGLLKKATDDAKLERERLFGEARMAADALSDKRRDALDVEIRTLDAALGMRAQKEVFAIARKVLADIAATGLEERIGGVFARRLREIPEEQKSELVAAMNGSSEPAIMRSAFDLPADQRAALQNALNETFSADIPLRFEVAPELVGGMELWCGGKRATWSVADYTTSLEKSAAELLTAKRTVATSAPSAPAQSAGLKPR